MLTDEQIRKIMDLTAYCERGGEVWGHDTVLFYSFKEYKDAVNKIIDEG